MKYRQSFLYKNQSVTCAMQLVIEPWAELYVIQPGDSVEVVAWSNEPGLTFEIHQDVKRLKVFWSGETVEIFRDGQLLEQSPQYGTAAAAPPWLGGAEEV